MNETRRERILLSLSAAPQTARELSDRIGIDLSAVNSDLANLFNKGKIRVESEVRQGTRGKRARVWTPVEG